jgi:hypothetical protein
MFVHANHHVFARADICLFPLFFSRHRTAPLLPPLHPLLVSTPVLEGTDRTRTISWRTRLSGKINFSAVCCVRKQEGKKVGFYASRRPLEVHMCVYSPVLVRADMPFTASSFSTRCTLPHCTGPHRNLTPHMSNLSSVFRRDRQLPEP